MPFKVAFIGAGSIGFTRRLLRDLLAVPEFKNMRVAFTDINKRNLDMVAKLCQRDLDANGFKIKIDATVDRRAALKGAKYIFCVVRVGGLDGFATDIDIPLKYGIDQCVGDTLCAGGIMYGQRGIAAILDFCKDIREVAAKDCLLLNYANPMAMLTWAANQYGGGVNCVGLCHGVQGGHHMIAAALGIDHRELDITAAGINHQTWYIRIGHRGKDLTGKLLAAMEKHPRFSQTEKVRIDMLRRFGYFSTESNGHLSEYVPWYRKRPREIRKWIDMGSWICGETGGYLRVCTEGRNWFQTEFPQWLKEPAATIKPDDRSGEHGSYIVEGLETGRVYRGHFNVVNGGVISNLPPDAVIEVPGYVDAHGMNIPKVGELPLGCAAVCNASVNVQRLAVEAAVQGNDTLLRQAMMMDPLTGAVCSPPEIWQMVDEMLVAQAKWLPQYKKAIAAARKRLKSGAAIKTKDGYRGVARLKTRSVKELQANQAEAKALTEADKAKKRPAASEKKRRRRTRKA